ncbi:MAG: class II aldolase/adducin family protein, partial [Nostoc sp.]
TYFGHIRVSDLILVNREGEVVKGDAQVNRAAFAIHSQLHEARPDVMAAAHAHSLYGKAWSSLGRLLDPLTQDSCAFYEDHALFDDFTGVVLETSEGQRLAQALGPKKAIILRNHSILTVG